MVFAEEFCAPVFACVALSDRFRPLFRMALHSAAPPGSGGSRRDNEDEFGGRGPCKELEFSRIRSCPRRSARSGRPARAPGGFTQLQFQPNSCDQILARRGQQAIALRLLDGVHNGTR
jgi:hypothetical protein